MFFHKFEINFPGKLNFHTKDYQQLKQHGYQDILPFAKTIINKEIVMISIVWK